MEERIACPTCQDKMELRKAKLMGFDVSTWECNRCNEVIYDFSGRGESCRTCSTCNECLWKLLLGGEQES